MLLRARQSVLTRRRRRGGWGGGWGEKPALINGARQCCMWFWLSLFVDCTYKLTLSEQAQVTLQLRVSVFRFSFKVFSPSAPYWEARKNFFHRYPNPLSRPFETTTLLTVIIAKLLLAAIITNIW